MKKLFKYYHNGVHFVLSLFAVVTVFRLEDVSVNFLLWFIAFSIVCLLGTILYYER